MGHNSFFIAGDHAAIIANDTNDLRYRGIVRSVPPGFQAPARTNDGAEILMLVEDGTLEIMIGGGSTLVVEGGFVRVPKHATFAYRNPGQRAARFLVRTEPPHDRSTTCRITLEFAA